MALVMCLFGRSHQFLLITSFQGFDPFRINVRYLD